VTTSTITVHSYLEVRVEPMKIPVTFEAGDGPAIAWFTQEELDQYWRGLDPKATANQKTR